LAGASKPTGAPAGARKTGGSCASFVELQVGAPDAGCQIGGQVLEGCAPPRRTGTIRRRAGQKIDAKTNAAVIVLFVLSLVLLSAVIFPIWRPLLVAAVIAGPLTGWHDRMAHALGDRRSLSAAVFTLSIIFAVLLPVAAASYFIVEQALELVNLVRHILADKGMAGLLAPLPDVIERWLTTRYRELLSAPREIMSQLHLWSRAGWAIGAFTNVLASVSHVLFELVLMLVAVFFLLRDGHSLTAWLKERSPLPRREVELVLRELNVVSKSIIGGNVLGGVAEAAVATIGYLIAGVPSPLFVGLLTFLASFVPSIGIAVVAIPAAGLLLLLGHPWMALFLTAWMIMVGLIDNFLRPLLMRGRAEFQGSLVFFSLMGGVLMFGAVGLVVGPLALAFVLAMTAALYPREVEGQPTDNASASVGEKHPPPPPSDR
jgi:predicted PurR-regulated permease PerM